MKQPKIDQDKCVALIRDFDIKTNKLASEVKECKKEGEQIIREIQARLNDMMNDKTNQLILNIEVLYQDIVVEQHHFRTLIEQEIQVFIPVSDLEEIFEDFETSIFAIEELMAPGQSFDSNQLHQLVKKIDKYSKYETERTHLHIQMTQLNSKLDREFKI